MFLRAFQERPLLRAFLFGRYRGKRCICRVNYRPFPCVPASDPWPPSVSEGFCFGCCSRRSIRSQPLKERRREVITVLMQNI